MNRISSLVFLVGMCWIDMCPADGVEEFLPSGRLALGANYWASHAATQMWSKWNETEVEKDLVAMKEAGMTVLRVFANWAEFQPIVEIHTAEGGEDKPRDTRMFLSEERRADTEAGFAGVDERMMERFARFCDLAERHGFKLIVCPLTGQMTVRLFFPPSFEGKNVYTDPYCQKWSVRYLRYFVGRLRTKKSIAAWEIGNESGIICRTEHHDMPEVWVTLMHNVIRLADPSRPIIGPDGLAIVEEKPWNAMMLGRLSDMLTMHSYGMWGNVYLDDMRSIRSMYFVSSQTTALADICGKPTFIEEHGARRQEQASQEHLADYMRGMLWNAWDADCRGMLWWCAFDQTGQEIAPYDWKEPCVELGIFRRNREPYPALIALKKFAAFQRALPFAALPKARTDALFIVSDPDVAKSSYILAKQAGLCPAFQSTDQPIREADCYFLPSATGRAHLSLRNWRKLKERVKEGATLYLSLNDTYLDKLEDVTGVEIDYRDAVGETVCCRGKELDFAFYSPVRRKFRVRTAETLAKNSDGSGVFYVNHYGKGLVYTLIAPLEAIFYRTPGKYATDACRIYGIVKPVPRLVNTGARDVIATEHRFPDGRCGVVVVNESATPYDGRPVLSEGWRVTAALTDDAEQATWSNGRLRLGPTSGILLMTELAGDVER